VNPLILAAHDSPPLPQITWDVAPGHSPVSMTPSQDDWHNFCLLSCSGSYSLPCCVQPGYVGTCLEMGEHVPGIRSMPTFYSSRPYRLQTFCRSNSMGEETEKGYICIVSTARL
jgi:hypothetical protein